MFNNHPFEEARSYPEAFAFDSRQGREAVGFHGHRRARIGRVNGGAPDTTPVAGGHFGANPKLTLRRMLTAALMASGLLILPACTEQSVQADAQSAPSAPAAVMYEGPSGLEVESEQAALAVREAQRVAAQAAAAEAQRHVEEAARAAAAARAAEAAQAAEEAAASQEAAPARGECIGYGCSAEQDAEINDLESRCSDGTATVEECFGPGSDLNDNGIADVNE